jgi:hypothetical protein
MSENSLRVEQELSLDASQYRSFCKEIFDDADREGMMGRVYLVNAQKKKLTQYIEKLALKLRTPFELQGVSDDTLEKAVRAVFIPANNARLEEHDGLDTTQTISPKEFTFHDIEFLVCRLGDPKQGLPLCGRKFGLDGYLKSRPGFDINATKWWEDMVVIGTQFDPASEEVVFLHRTLQRIIPVELTSIERCLCAAVDDAMARQQDLVPFLIRPKGSKEGSEQLIELIEAHRSPSNEPAQTTYVIHLSPLQSRTGTHELT